MRDRGHAKLIKQTRKIERAGQESETVWGIKLRREKIEALAHEIEKEHQFGGKSTFTRFLRDTPLTTLQIADRAITVGLWNTQLARPATFTQAFTTLGEELEKDARWVMKQAGKAQPLPWNEEDQLHIGGELFGIMHRAVGIVEGSKFRDRDDAHPTLYLTVDETTQEYRKHTLASTQRPQWMPMIESPQPWDAHGLRGGYLDADQEFEFTLVLGNEHAATIPSPHVIEAVNIVQSTAWRINTRVLDVMEQMWKEQHKVGKLPANIAPEPYRLNTKLKAAKEDDADEVAVRKAQAAIYEGYNQHLSSEGKRHAAAATLRVAMECRAFERIYFPHRIDFRGRMYPVPEHLTPQGPDYARALLTFAEGQPLASRYAFGSLAVHGANMWGAKGSFEQRHGWVVDHWEEILECAADHTKYGWWRQAAKPWQFLAFCFEWQGLTEAQDRGEAFVSHLPVALDGTCNGLQHYAAMMRDEKSGAATNLTGPSVPFLSEEEQLAAFEVDRAAAPVTDARGDVVMAPPQDLYQQVADEVVTEIQKSRKLLVDGTEIDEDAAEKLRALAEDRQINRKMMKNHVMTVPYGKTPHSRWVTLEEYLTDPDESGTQEALWEDIPSDAITYLNNTITKAIEKHVPAAKEAMDWLRKITKLLAKTKQPVTWVTPSGLQITQHYRDISTRQVEMRARNSITGKPYKLTLAKHGVDDAMDAQSQATSIAPNFVHSMDAAHLVETVRLAKSQGITSFAMVHDSYATTAAETETLTAALTTAFRTMYQRHNVLAELRDRVVAVLGDTEVPAAPLRGDLKLGEMPYLFS